MGFLELPLQGLVKLLFMHLPCCYSCSKWYKTSKSAYCSS